MDLRQVNYTQLSATLIAVIVVIGVVAMYATGQTPPEIMLGAFGLVLGHFFNRQASEDMLGQSERVARGVVVDRVAA